MSDGAWRYRRAYKRKTQECVHGHKWPRRWRLVRDDASVMWFFQDCRRLGCTTWRRTDKFTDDTLPDPFHPDSLPPTRHLQS